MEVKKVLYHSPDIFLNVDFSIFWRTSKQAKLFFEMSKTFEATSFRGMEMPRKKIKIRNKVSKKICLDNYKTSYDNLKIILKVWAS